MRTREAARPGPSGRLPNRPSLESFVQGTNLLDQTIRYSTSPLKEIVPLGARAVIAEIRGVL